MPYEIQYRPMAEYAPTRRVFLGVAGAAAVGFLLSGRSRFEPVHATSIEPKDVQIAEFNHVGRRAAVRTVPTVVKADWEWRQQLGSAAFDVTRQQHTERAYSGKFWNNPEKGIYSCVCCGTAAFSSEAKFESGGWASFWKPVAKENVRETASSSLLMKRVTVSCPRCAAHLGRVFEDGPAPTGRRYRINSLALQFTKTA